jgi:hypothetical protein
MFNRSYLVVLRCSILLALLMGSTSLVWAQNSVPCTTDPFDHRILPLCAPGGDGGGTTIGPEDLLDFTQSPNGSWQVKDISQLTGVQVLGAPPSAIQVGSEYHVYVPNAANGHPQEFVRNSCGIWSAIDLVAAVGQSFAASVLTAILTPSGTEHVFVTGNGHLLDFAKNPGAPWTLTDVSVAVGLGSSSTFSPSGHVAVVQIGSDIHVYAFATDLEEYYLPAGGSWVFTDVSTAVGGGLQLEGSSLAATNTGSAAQVYVASSNGHVLNFQGSSFTASGGHWQVFDQTANSGGSVRFAGLPYVSASPVVNSTGVYLFIDGGPNGVADLEQMLEINGQWQTSDLSQTATNGTSLGLVSQPFALLDASNIHVYVPGSGGHLLEFFKQPNANWVVTDVSSVTGPTLLGIGTTAFRDAGTGEFQVFANGTPASPASTQSVVRPCFSLSAGPPTTSVVLQGGSTSYQVTVNPINGFSGSVFLSASGLPSGTNANFNPNPTTSLSTMTVTANGTAALGTFPVSITGVSGNISASTNVTLLSSPPPLASRFVPVTPCRIADTRNPSGPFGGPFLTGGMSREFVIPSSACNIPSGAQAYALNITVVPKGILGFLTMYPCGETLPLTSNLNSIDGRVKAVATIVPAGPDGGVCAFAFNDTDLILDISGYFVPSSTSALAFYPLTPCRIADTRNPTGPFGGPAIAGSTSRTFPILSSSCNVPGAAQAYSLNFTAVPHGALGYITTWAAGQTQPPVSTLNAPTGAVTANAAIVTAGVSGGVSVFASNDTDLIIDINGYFAPPGAGGLSLFTLTPCRLLDTRNPPGSAPFNGTLNPGPNVAASGCGVPPVAAGATNAYVFNATVVPPGALGFLTLWPNGVAQPPVSTLNAIDGAVTSNMAIVSTTNGSVNAFGLNPTQLVLDIYGYFAP